MTLVQALISAITALSLVVVALWRENLKWQDRWAEEVRSHSQSSELFKTALEKLRSKHSGQNPSKH